MHFGRVLRRAGLPIGPGQVLAALNAVEAVGLGSRVDFYWTLYSVFVNRRDQRDLFDQAFHIFWRNPDILERMMQIMLPDAGGAQQSAEDAEEISRRLAEALNPNQDGGDDNEEGEEEITFDATLTWSAGEVLGDKDFEKMSSEEIRDALDAIRRMRLPIMEVPTRRFRAHPSGGRIDMRRSLRAALRSGSDYIPLMKRKRRTRHPPLVIICDISGSMERYSRMMLHFMHAITNDRDRVHTFLFGTRLTNVTRYLRYKDVDAALERVGEAVVDWSGGTRIGHSVHEFNQNWSRRVLTQGAVTVLISDGLDRDEGTGLALEMERLHKSCRRLIWLNPLLRYEGFEPKSVGIRAILPHVDEFRTIHNLDSMRDLTRVLGAETPRNMESMARWRSAAA
ncbi:MAG: VWA domain-containing protein [Rhodospirillaceae bacterium]|nr:VWA domain-containing protein [Rhodospirillaceae bacterium]MBT3884551.1 VWA domain-containing protein [Rhodospirillaceae bacterium]MBT4114882.1 VWA domain-containing protein [Rhodospirillaceae bacterium]MBT4671263.1 VWA domain-containing protein [Rhodospirillaceae bacterium]MBT4718225.1 VWA domain-containing protein [Rhodospirillaceae bacterium]